MLPFVSLFSSFLQRFLRMPESIEIDGNNGMKWVSKNNQPKMSKKLPTFHCHWFLPQKKKKSCHVFPSVNFVKMELFQKYTNKCAMFSNSLLTKS